MSRSLSGVSTAFALGAGLEERLAQPLELFLLGMQRPQISIGRRRSCDLGQDGLGIAQLGLLVE